MNLSKTNEDLKNKCIDAIKKTEDVERNLDANVKEVKKHLQQVKNEYCKEVDAVFKKHEDSVDTLKVQRAVKLGRVKEGLQTALAKVENIHDLITEITQKGSDYDIATTYSTLSASLEELYLMTKPTPASMQLGHVFLKKPSRLNFQLKIPDELEIVTGDMWTLTREFKTKSELEYPWALRVHPSGGVAVTQNIHQGDKCAKFFSGDEQVKFAFQGPFSGYLYDVAATPDERYILSGTRFCFTTVKANGWTTPKLLHTI